MKGPIRVLVADDQALLRGSFRVLIESTPGFVVTGEASTGGEAVVLAERDRPDVVLMDVRMPEMDGIEATRRICASSPGPRVLILTMFDLDPYVYDALRAGASGFLLKDTPPEDLLTAVRVVAAGQSLLAPTVTQRLVERLARAPVDDRSIADLTAREREILVLVARGFSNTEIADRKRIGLSTVKTHLSHLLAKLAARDRAQLVIAAYETGLVAAAAPREQHASGRAVRAEPDQPSARDGSQTGTTIGHRR
jgi:DNA-binding NarL/FixJ family response regulator